MIRRILKLAALGAAFILVAGASAYFTVSFIIKGEDRVVVPDLTGKDVVHILETLTQLGLNTKVKGSEYSDQIPVNHILSQDPAPGSEIKKGRDVRIVLSKGPQTLLAPNLKGLPLRQARIILEQNGICPGNVSRTDHPSVTNETILAQFPDRGAELTPGRCVDMLVSTGPKPQILKMPDLKGRSFSEAMFAVRQMNFTLGRIEVGHEKDLPEDAVVGQDPPAGHPVLEGNPVKLIRNRKEDIRGPSAGIIPKGAKLFRYRVRDGFLKTHIRLKFEGYGLSEEMIDAYLDPGEEIMLLIPMDAGASLWLYEDDTLVVSQRFKP